MSWLDNGINYDDVAALERYLSLPKDALRNIPIYARVGAVDAILKVKEMESKSLFRPGLYYIVLADLCHNTDFNAKYGDAEGDVRVQWFQTTVIQTLGEIHHRNYCTFIKTIGDAALLIFSSFLDVFEWSNLLTKNLSSMTGEYPENMEIRNITVPDSEYDERLADFDMKARRLVHLGEVSYTDGSDPLSLAVSQTFKIEKNFSEIELGCTEFVADAIKPKLNELSVKLYKNKSINIPGIEREIMSYYVK